MGILREVTTTGGPRIEYLVDGQSRRVAKRVDGVLTRAFLYDGSFHVVAELDGQMKVVSQFVYGSRANVPDALIRAGVAYRIITDHLGSPRLMVNAETGAIVQRMDYDESGRVRLDTNPGFQPFGFAGGLYDPDTHLIHFGAREYDPDTGRWTRKDPLLMAGGDPNLYGDAAGDPVNRVDSLGLGPELEPGEALKSILEWMGGEGLTRDRIFLDMEHAYTLQWDPKGRQDCVEASKDRATVLQGILSNYSQNGDWTVSVITADSGLHTMNMITYQPHGSTTSQSYAIDNYVTGGNTIQPVKITGETASTWAGNQGIEVWSDSFMFGTRTWVWRQDSSMPGTSF